VGTRRPPGSLQAPGRLTTLAARPSSHVQIASSQFTRARARRRARSGLVRKTDAACDGWNHHRIRDQLTVAKRQSGLICYGQRMTEEANHQCVPIRWQGLVYGGGGFLVGFLTVGGFAVYAILHEPAFGSPRLFSTSRQHWRYRLTTQSRRWVSQLRVERVARAASPQDA
jgi:hypothetical protein